MTLPLSLTPENYFQTIFTFPCIHIGINYLINYPYETEIFVHILLN